MAINGIRPIKVTIVGDGAVGKTCMLIAYTRKEFPKEYVPTIFDNYVDNITVDGQQFNMTLWDTAGQEDYERLRPLSYPDTNCFLICYSISSRVSYENILMKWLPEIKHFSPTVPIILVGTKKDLRSNPFNDKELISIGKGKQLAKQMKAYSFVECSALCHDGLQEVFEQAVKAITKRQPEKSKSCTLL